jgi:hypothetical protein
MTTHPDRIFVPGITRVYLGPVGTPAPTVPSAAYDAGLLEVGLFTRDSLKFKRSSTVTGIKGHQSDYPLLDVESDPQGVLLVDLQEWSRTNFQEVYSGGTISEPLPGIWRFDPPAYGGSRLPRMAVARCVDGGRTYTLIIPRCVQLDGVEHSLGSDKESILPLALEMRPLPDQQPFYWLNDDDDAWT